VEKEPPAFVYRQLARHESPAGLFCPLRHVMRAPSSLRESVLLIHVAGFNLGVLMRALMGCGTPRERTEAARNAFLFVVQTDSATAIVIIADIGGAQVMLAVVAPEHKVIKLRLGHRAVKAGGKGAAEVAKQLGVSRASIYRLFADA
jgi:hypothetical protein